MMSLPSGYTQVEYIESGSLQYINTGFYPNQDTRVIWKAYNNSSSSAWIYGARKTGSSGLFGAMIGNGIVYGTQTATIDMTAVGEMEIDHNKNEYRYNDIAGSLTEQTFSSDYPMYLFACNGSGEATSLRFNGKLYSCKIYDGETLARDYIPCKNPNGLVGLYDLVNGEFYTQADGGAFISGPEVIIHKDINFATLQGLTIPEGVVTQITDASGMVLWKKETSKPVVLEVAKQTLTTYAGETSYADESFILLDIYPKSANSTVDVTYGGLTKTLTFSGTNAQPVFFGTFNGVTDSVETPASGTLTIEGGYSNFSTGSYQSGSKTTNISHCGCITNVIEWGDLKEIGTAAFQSCADLNLSELPDCITVIGSDAFQGCTNLALTSLPSGITVIGSDAFYDCSSLALTELPSGLTSIASYAFCNCSALAFTYLPSGITSIAMGAFSGCTNLALAALPSGLTSIASHAFYECSSLALTELPSGITSIDGWTFYRCTNLALTSLPSGLTSTGDYAFFGCSSLALTELPSGMTSIGKESFSSCANMPSVTIPDSVTSIGESAFYIPGLSAYKRTVIMQSATPAILGASAFDYPGKNNIIVPAGCGDSYKAAEGWSTYADYITEAS